MGSFAVGEPYILLQTVVEPSWERGAVLEMPSSAVLQGTA